MKTIAEFREEYPQYDSYADQELADALHSKFYSDIDKAEFDKSFLGQVESPTLSKDVREVTFYEDQAKAGAADFVFGLLPDKAFGIDSLDSKYFNFETRDFDREAYEKDLAQAKDEARREFFGYKGIKPTSKLQTYGGGAVRTVTGEGPLAFVGARSAPGAVAELLHAFSAAAAGLWTAEEAGDYARSLGFGETGQGIAEGVVGFLAGAGTSMAGVPIQKGREALSSAISKRKESLKSVEEATDRFSLGEVESILKGASEAQPGLNKFIDETLALQDAIPGLVIPPASIMADNPIIRKNLDRLLKTNPEFFAKINGNVQDAMSAVKSFREARFGEGGQLLDGQMKKAVREDSGIKLNNVNKKIRAIDQQIESRTSKLDTGADYTAIGESAKNLMAAKEKAVRDKLKPKYAQAIRQAELDGVEMPPESVGNLHSLVRLQKLEDIFGVEPALARLIDKTFSPKEEVFQSSILLPGGGKQPEIKTKVFEPASVKDIDSLKRNLNSAIRKTSDRTAQTKLIEFKKQFQAELDKLDTKFVSRIRDLDRRFYEELGIPMSAEGVKQLDSSRFATTAGEYLTRPDQARDFLAFTGDKGLPVVKDAILLKIYEQTMRSGTFNAGKYAQLMRDKKISRVVDLVPGFRAELETSGAAIKDMLEVRARLDADFAKRSTELAEGFALSVKNKKLSDVVQEIIARPQVSAQYLNDIKNFSPDTARMLKKGVRAGMLEKAFASKGTTLEFISENKNTFDAWFGPRYMKDVETAAKAADVLNKIALDGRFAVDLRNEDVMRREVGISFPETQSLLRDRITNAGTKVAIAFSKITSRNVDAKRDGTLMEILSNPDALRQVAQQIEKSKLSTKSVGDITAEQMSQLSMLVNKAFYKGGYFGAEAAADYRTLEEEAQPSQ